MNNRNSKSKILSLAILCIIVMIVIVILALLLKSNETYTSENREDKEIGYLHCEANVPQEAFFTPEGVLNAQHELKVVFRNNRGYKISYNYEGEFANVDAAKNAESLMHGNYNIYLGHYSINPESLYPTFVTDGAKLKINLYADESKLNSITKTFFFLDTNEVSKLGDYDNGELKEFYERKGFKCALK